MSLDVVDFIATIITGIVGSILCIILLVLHCCKYYKHEISASKNNKSSKSKKSFVYKLMSIFTILSMIFFTMVLLQTLPSIFVCNNILLTDGNYPFAKLFTHLVLIMRLHLVYKNSKYKYKLKTLIILAIIIIIAYSVPMITGYLMTSIQKEEITLFGETIIRCWNLWPDTLFIHVVLLTGATIEIMMYITITIAFVYPLTKIIKSLKKDYNHRDHSDEELKKPLIKATILTLIIVIGSLLANAMFAVFRVGAFILIHGVSVCLCIMLMTPYHDKLYKRLCCGILKCISFIQMKHEMTKAVLNINKYQTEDNDIKPEDVEETVYDTRTLATLPQENKKYENQSDYTQTVHIEMGIQHTDD